RRPCASPRNRWSCAKQLRVTFPPSRIERRSARAMPRAATTKANAKTDAPTRTAAERMQVSRDRRRMGIMPVRMLLGPVHLDGLRKAGFLDEGEITNDDAADAVRRLLVALRKADTGVRIGDLAGG